MPRSRRTLVCGVRITTWAALAILATGGCASSPKIAPVPNLFDVQKQIETYISSGRYESDCAAVADRARAYLQARAPQVSKPAVVFDIGQAALHNWAPQPADGWGRLTAREYDIHQG